MNIFRFNIGKIIFAGTLIAFTSLIAVMPKYSFAQEREEPQLVPLPEPRSPYTEDRVNGIGFKLMLNNYGFGLGGEYRRALNATTEFFLNANISNLKDESEQTLQTWFGQQIIPNKYNRVLVFPVMAGLKQRLFPSQLSDNFRAFLQGGVGVAPAFVYPYFDDARGLGYRDPARQLPYDVFQGWSDGYFTTGMTGELAIGVDFGADFSQLQSVRFGYRFYYYPDSIQIMEPNSYIPGLEGFDAQSFFISPEITIVLGSNW